MKTTEELLKDAIDALERLSRIGCKQGRNIAKQALEEIRSAQPKTDPSV